MQQIIVTGGSGYIGSHTCKEIALHGYQPVIVDKVKSQAATLLQEKYNALFYQVDITDEAALEHVFKKHKDALGIIHFAGLISVAESCHHPNLYYKNNVVGSANILSLMEALSIRNIVFSSSAAVYGVPKEFPVKETAPKEPINPYGHSKRILENMLEGLSNADIINYASLRYFNACGADPEGEFGECHEPETHLIPLAIEAAYRQTEFSVFGDDYATKDGTAVRDFIHVKDLAIAHIKAIEFLHKKQESLIANLGTGDGYSVMEIVTQIAEISGKKVPLKVAQRREGDPPTLVADNSISLSKLGFKPSYSSLEQIISSAIGWYVKHNSA